MLYGVLDNASSEWKSYRLPLVPRTTSSLRGLAASHFSQVMRNFGSSPFQARQLGDGQYQPQARASFTYSSR